MTQTHQESMLNSLCEMATNSSNSDALIDDVISEARLQVCLLWNGFFCGGYFEVCNQL